MGVAAPAAPRSATTEQSPWACRAAEIGPRDAHEVGLVREQHAALLVLDAQLRDAHVGAHEALGRVEDEQCRVLRLDRECKIVTSASQAWCMECMSEYYLNSWYLGPVPSTVHSVACTVQLYGVGHDQ